MTKNKKFVIGGLLAALILGVIAGFFYFFHTTVRQETLEHLADDAEITDLRSLPFAGQCHVAILTNPLTPTQIIISGTSSVELFDQFRQLNRMDIFESSAPYSVVEDKAITDWPLPLSAFGFGESKHWYSYNGPFKKYSLQLKFDPARQRLFVRVNFPL